MSTVNQIIYKIKERHSGFNITDDYPIPDELIYSFMNDIRETLIREELRVNREINEQYYSMNCCLEIECVTNECEVDGETISSPTGMYKVKLPVTVTKIGELDIKYVGDKSGVNSFNRYNFNTFRRLEYRVWTKRPAAYSIVGNEMWLRNLSTPNQMVLCVLGLFKEPIPPCEWDNEEYQYPVPSEKKLVDLTLLSLQTSSKIIDILNNAANDQIIPKINQQTVAEQQQVIRADQQQEQQQQRRG